MSLFKYKNVSFIFRKKKKNNSDIKEKEEEENRILFLPLRSFRTIHLKHRVSAMKCYEIMIGHWMMFTRILAGYHYTYKKINMHFYLKLYPRLNSYVWKLFSVNDSLNSTRSNKNMCISIIRRILDRILVRFVSIATNIQKLLNIFI